MRSSGWSHCGLEAQDPRDPNLHGTSTSCPTQDPAACSAHSAAAGDIGAYGHHSLPSYFIFSEQDSVIGSFHLLPNTPVQPSSKRAIQEHSRVRSRLQLGNHLPPDSTAARALR